MRVLIAGAAGFLGSHLTDRFLKDGHSVVGMDNLSTGRLMNLDHLASERGFEFMECDITAPLPFTGHLDGVLNLASPASPPAYLRLPLETLMAGSLGTKNLLQLAKDAGARFLQASTSEVYGDPEIHPQTEEYWGRVNPIGARSVYDEAKRFAEALVSAYRRSFGMNTKIARIFNTYGPRMDPADGRVVTNFMVQALQGKALTLYGEGTQTRSFCYVSDQVDGLYRLFHSEEPGPINLGNPSEYTIRELLEIVLEITNSHSEVRRLPMPEDDPKVRRPDISKARERLGWNPNVKLRDGLHRTLPHFRRELEGHGADPFIIHDDEVRRASSLPKTS